MEKNANPEEVEPVICPKDVAALAGVGERAVRRRLRRQITPRQPEALR